MFRIFGFLFYIVSHLFIKTNFHRHNNYAEQLFDICLKQDSEGAITVLHKVSGVRMISIQETMFHNIKPSCLYVSSTEAALNISVLNTKYIGIGNRERKFSFQPFVAIYIISKTKLVNVECTNVTYLGNKGTFVYFQHSLEHGSNAKVTVSISNSVFAHNRSPGVISLKSAVYYIVQLSLWSRPNSYIAGMLKITNTIFMSNDGGVSVSNFINVLFENVTMTMIKGEAIQISEDHADRSRRLLTLVITNCLFENNAESLSITT